MFGRKRKEYNNLKSVRIDLENYIRFNCNNNQYYLHKSKDIVLLNYKQRRYNGDFWLNDKIKNEEYHITALSVAFNKEFLDFEEMYKSKVKRYKRNINIANLIE